jgi:hypothetical protein
MAILVVRIVVLTAGDTTTWDVREFAGRLGFILAASVLAAAGALGLAAGWSGGLYLLAAATLASLAIGLVIAWVLLVEVRRLASKAAGSGAGPDAGRPTGTGPVGTGPSARGRSARGRSVRGRSARALRASQI